MSLDRVRLKLSIPPPPPSPKTIPIWGRGQNLQLRKMITLKPCPKARLTTLESFKDIVIGHSVNYRFRILPS